jgi:hypothetical protein
VGVAALFTVIEVGGLLGVVLAGLALEPKVLTDTQFAATWL